MWKVNGQQMPSDGKSSHCFWQGELKSLKKPSKDRQLQWPTKDKQWSTKVKRYTEN